MLLCHFVSSNMYPFPSRLSILQISSTLGRKSWKYLTWITNTNTYMHIYAHICTYMHIYAQGVAMIISRPTCFFLLSIKYQYVFTIWDSIFSMICCHTIVSWKRWINSALSEPEIGLQILRYRETDMWDMWSCPLKNRFLMMELFIWIWLMSEDVKLFTKSKSEIRFLNGYLGPEIYVS